MSTSLTPFGMDAPLPARVGRQLARQVATDRADIERFRARESRKLATMGDLTRDALGEAAETVHFHRLVCQAVPEGEPLFTTITQAGVMGMAQVVMRAGQRLA